MLQSRSFGCFGKWLATGLLCLMRTCLISAGVQAAGNISDTLYEYTEYGDHLIQVTTDYREKWDDTSCYAYNMKSNCDITKVEVLGLNDPRYGAYHCTYGPYKSLPRGAAYYFPNLVYERGYDNACLTFHFNKIGAYLYVWWSPDSV